jgi:dienelactone hydrolase
MRLNTICFMNLLKLIAGLLLLTSQLAIAQVPWPNYISQLEHDTTESAVLAVAPADVVIAPPDSSVSADKARWSGAWSGWGCAARACDIKLIVESVTQDGAALVYVGASAPSKLTQRTQAKFVGEELTAPLSTGSFISLRMRSGDDKIAEFVIHKDGTLRAAGVLSQTPALAKVSERLPTRFVENGKLATLEIVIYKPPGDGPFPTLMFNHGSTGNGDNPALFNSTWSSATLARFFTDKGWLVAFPQRRGRGKSDGLYDEGFEENRSRYACSPALSLPGLERALSDMDAATDYLAGRPDVDSKHMLVGGQSRGGIASVAYAGTRPTRFMGVINFVGGWVGDRCVHADAINSASFKRGAAFATPMLWLYGENDPFYKIEHSRKNFDTFVSAGGKGVFKVFSPATGQSGHGLVAMPNLWLKDLTSYLDQLDLK